MKKNIFLIAISMLFCSNLLYLNAQSDAVRGGEKKSDKSEIIEYKISPIYNVNTSHKYHFTEKSSITRVLSDSSSSSYKRNLEYFTTLRAPSVPKDNIVNVICGIDSMKYEYSDGVVSVKWDSQDDDANPPFKYFDFERNMIILSKEFDLTISAYNEPTNLKSEQIDEILTNLRDPATGMKDTLRKFSWENALNMSNLQFFADVNKGITPDKKVAIDSTWIDVVHLVIDGVVFKDSVLFKLENYNTRVYTIVGKSLKLRAVPSIARFQGIGRLCNVVSGDGDATYKMQITNRGIVDFLEINSNAKMIGKIGKDEFTQKVHSEFKWQLDKLYKW